MAFVWERSLEIEKESGQTIVEYILLLIVSVSLVMTFYKSATFKSLFGETGSVGMAFKEQTEWGYRHAYLMGARPSPTSAPYSSASSHPSYYNQAASKSRFFGPYDPYPQ
jgi:hypothetical protein